MNFEIVPAFAVSLEEQARLANAAFAGYVGGWADLDAAGVARFLLLQGADLFHSRLVRNANGLVGFGYITRAGNVVRLSGMGIIPAARGSGAADFLLHELFADAEASGDAAMLLEVIEQNPRAHSLYKRHGFREISRLTGWRLATDTHRDTKTAAPLERISVLDALRAPSAREYPEIPWQISRHAFAKVPNARAYRHGNVRLVISDPEAQPIRVYSLLSGSGDWVELRDAVSALAAEFPDRELFLPAIWPEEFGTNVFEPLGFAQEPISQFLMRRDF
jgi:ribosomal protein S18 acetylase RimI-like enzyme